MKFFLVADIKNNRSNYKALFIILFFRVAHFFSERRNVWWLFIVGFPIRLCYKLIVEWVLGVEIPAPTKIGEGLRIHHGQGLVLNPRVILGRNVTLKHNTTIGASTNEQDKFIGAPIIGNNVIIHPHSIIIGNILIGDNVIIGAGSVVVKNIESNSIAVGNPARVIKKITNIVNE